MEMAVDNARETFSFIDLVCEKCSKLGTDVMIEYKSGPGSITKETIKKQFIERDLFKVNSLEELQWRMKNVEFSPEKLKSWMKDNKDAINAIKSKSTNPEKFKKWFDLDKASSPVSINDIDYFVDEYYSKIFK